MPGSTSPAMLYPAFLTALLFAMSIFCAGRSTRMMGSTLANYTRLVVGIIVLAIYGHTLGQGWSGPGLTTLLLSGAIGIGIGDFCTFRALRMIAPGLAVLLVQCFCAPFAALIEWLWLGTTLTAAQGMGIATILAGTTLSLIPGIRIDGARKMIVRGALLAMGGALMQAIGAVLTRNAYALNEAAGITISGMTAAYQRICGAFVVMTVVFLVYNYLSRRMQRRIQEPEEPKPWRKAMPWITANALFGLVFGIACFQWALMSMPSAVALSIVALTPLFAMPLSWAIDGERPKLLGLLGAVIAVSGVVVLKFL